MTHSFNQSTFLYQVANNLLTLLQGYSKTIRLLLVMLLTLTVTTNAWAEEATLSFANKAQRTSFSNTQQVWEQNGVTFTNDKASSTNAVADYASPVRLYQNSSVTVACSVGNMTKIVFDCNSTSYATAMKNSIGSSATASSDKVTVTLDGTSNTFTAQLSAQVRLDGITVTYTSGGGGSDPTQLAAPTGLTVDAITSSGATLSWNTVANASSYVVTIVDGGSLKKDYPATGITTTVSDLESSTDYLWTVTAVGDGINYTNSEESVTSEFTTSAAAGGDGGKETWTLVTNASNLETGDQIVIAAKDYNFAISTTQNNNNRGQAAITKSGDNITFGSDVQILTLEAGTKSSTFGFNTGSGYLYASSSSGNQLKTQATNDDNGSWSISISSGTATIKANGTNSRNIMQYNQSSSLFACYGSASQKALAIYKKVTSSGGGTSTYTITSTLSHVTADGGNPKTITSEDTELELSYSADTDWNLPENITITMGVNELTDSEYVWDNENGDLFIEPTSGFTGNIVVTINGWQQLAAPTGLDVSKITSSTATLSWNTVANASSYTIVLMGNDDQTIEKTTTNTSIDITGLNPETYYIWSVTAIGNGSTYIDSDDSDIKEFTTPAAAAPTAGYTIIHHRQALDGNYIADSLVVKTTGTADVGSTITAEQKTYTGFVCNDVVQTITIQEDAAQNVVTYKYVRQSYTLTWDLDGGTIVTAGTPAGTVKYGAPLTAPTVEKAGYRFDHWNPNVPATMQDGNRTYKAFYTQQHTVKWVSQGTVIRTDIYDTGAALEAAPTTGIVECDGKKHVGWTAQGGYAHSTAAPADLFTESSGTVTADATYYAVYAEGSGGGGTGWTVVTSTSDLEAGATYAISNESTGGTYLSTWDGGNNFDGSTITICHLILGGLEGAWTFQISDESTHNNKYLTATSAVSNRLKAVNPVDEWSYFTISFDGNAAVITCTGKNTNNILRYNANNGSPIFACYSSGQSDVYLQKQTGGGGYTNYTTSCASITSIRIEEQTTTFDQYDAFNFGGTVYAIDEEYNETDVTELATFTGYDMSQAGTQTVTVSYSGCSVTYEITVNKLPVWNITWSVGGKTNTGIGPREVVQGKTIGECSSTGNLQIPEVPAGCEGKLFMGWSASSTVKSDGSDFTPITSATVPETNVTYYAVFAEPTGNGGAQGELFSESFETIKGSGGNDDKWDGNIASAQLTEHGDWEFTNAYKGYECIKLGKANGQGQATTPALGINGSATLTFAAGAWNGNNELLTINLQIVGEGSITPSSVTTLTKGQFTTYTANITDANADTKVQFIAANAANNRFFLDEVKVSGGSSDSYTDYSTSCGTYTVTFYGFNSGGYTTTCNDNPAVDEVEQGGTYVIPNCEPTFDPAKLGRTFAGTWNTQANGKGTAYKPGDEFIVNNDITLYAQWALNTSGNTTLPTDVEDLATTDVVVTGGTTLTLQAGTTTINSLTLKGGLQEGGTYAMPIINVPNNATLVRKDSKIHLDLTVNNQSYYPFAVPFEVQNIKANIHYLDETLNDAATYGKHYQVLTYDGALRAENGLSDDNWVEVGRHTAQKPSYLVPGKGYAISAVPAKGETTTTIRISMDVDDDWFAGGEQISLDTITRNQIAVTAHTGAAADKDLCNAGWNFVANPYLTNFAANNISGAGYINGQIVVNNGKFEHNEEEIPYVTIPNANMSWYDQCSVRDAKLSPMYSFFVQIAEGGTMTFTTDGRQQAPAALRASSEQANPSFEADIVILNNLEQVADHTGLVINDRWTPAYEIGGDLEKMFGTANRTAIYTLSGNTRLAYNALSYNDALVAIPIGFRAQADGEYTIQLSNTEDIVGVECIELKDLYNNQTTNLLYTDYTFYSDATQEDSRFVVYIVPQKNTPTDISTIINGNTENRKIIFNNHLYIIHNGNIYNGAGQMVK